MYTAQFVLWQGIETLVFGHQAFGRHCLVSWVAVPSSSSSQRPSQALRVQGVCLVTCVPMWNHDRTYLKHTGSGSTGANKMVISLEPGSRRPSSCSQSTKQVLCEFEGEISRDKNRSYAGDKDRREKKIWVEEVKEDFFPPFCKENKTHFYTYFKFWTKIWEV